MKRFTAFPGWVMGWLFAGACFLLTPNYVLAQQAVGVLTTKAHMRPTEAIITAQSEPVKLKKGINGLLFRGIASSAETSSIRINAGESTRVLGYKWVTDSSHLQDDQVVRLNAELQVKNDSLQSAQRAEQRLLYARKVLNENIQIDVSDKSIYIDDLDELVIYYKNALRRWDKEYIELKHHKKRINHQLDSLETSKRRRVATLRALNTGLFVQISAQLEVERTVDFSYQTKSAFWEPTYFVSLTDQGNASIEMSASIQQQTGLNWKQIDLSLEFGNTNKTTLNKVFSANYLTTNYKVNVPNGETTFIFDLKSIDCSYEVFNLLNPNVSAHPFISLQLSNLSGYTLPRGIVTIKTPSGYQSTDTLASVLTSDSLVFSIGIDNEILCTKSISKEKLTKSIVGNKQTLNVEWNAQLTNNSGQQQVVTYADYLPANIEGATVESSLPKGSITADGKFSYAISLEPGETKTISYKFKIAAPKGVDINDYYTK